jgi:nostrin
LWLKNDDETDETSQQLTDHNDNDADLNYLETTDCVDIRNEALIQHLGPNSTYAKLKSNSLGSDGEYQIKSEIKVNGVVNGVNGKSATMSSDKSNDSPIWDREAADGVSNQPDSDFGEFQKCLSQCRVVFGTKRQIIIN